MTAPPPGKRARKSTTDLFAFSPETAVVREGGAEGRERSVAAEEVRPGDTLVIRPGERVPVDAVVFKGSSDLNEALLTGESIPVDKTEGYALYAGTVNGRGLLLAKAERPRRHGRGAHARPTWVRPCSS